jgi:hypothetical protein
MDSQKAEGQAHPASLVVKQPGFDDVEVWAPAIDWDAHRCLRVDEEGNAHTHLAGNPEWEALKADIAEVKAQMQQIRLVLAELAESLR